MTNRDEAVDESTVVSSADEQRDGTTPPASTPADAISTPPAIDMSRFEVIDTIGSGGMGVVLVADDLKLERKVAIKLLRADVWRGDSSAERGKRRMMREAQAIGRLSHPNVITVFEVGHTGDGGVFVAMEYVDGGTLRDRLAQVRPWQQVVADFIGAGRGLAAAHAAGMVHRDFKPDNVLIGKDGRIRVTDFGLVAAIGGAVAAGTGDDACAEDGLAPSPHFDSNLTRSGAVLGTPRYMAPEQHLGQRVDARADQFSFCVALYHALYGVFPFASDSARGLSEAVVAGARSEVPGDRDVPRHLVRLLERGLQVAPDDRYPSMLALLADLAHDPAARRRRIGIAMAAACLAAIALYGFARSTTDRRADPCPVASDRLAGVWDGATKRAMAAQFRAVQGAAGEATYRRAAALLDEYTDAWLRAHTDACQATRVRGEQSPALHALRTACLDRRLAHVAALTMRLTTDPDKSMVAHAVGAVYDLTPLVRCDDAESLRTRAPVLAGRATQARIGAARKRLSDIVALRRTGQISPALLLAVQLEADTRDSSYPQLRAEVLLSLGLLQARARQHELASVTLHAATLAAAAAKDDRRAALAGIELVRVRGLLRTTEAEALAIVGSVRATIARSGGDAELSARLLSNAAFVLDHHGKRDDAEQRYQRAIVLLERERGRDHRALIVPLHGLGMLWRAARRDREALVVLQRGVDIAVASFGPGQAETERVRAALASVGRDR